MKALLILFALLLCPVWVSAQGVDAGEEDADPVIQDNATVVQPTVASPATAPGEPAATEPAAVAVAFSIHINAPDDISTLLERHLELQRYRTLTDLSDDELDRLLEMAREDARKLVATLGYFSAVIDIKRQSVSNASAERSVNITVTAGEPVQVGQVIMRFAGPIAQDPAATLQRQFIQDSWSLPTGNRFTQSRWEDAKQLALRQLTSQRYPLGTISQSLADVDPVTHTVQLEVTLESGAAYQLGESSFTGLKKFDVALARRLARIQIGSDYDLKQLVSAQQRLTESGYFDSAFVTIDTASDPKAAKVLITVREALQQKITLGIGASTDSGPRLSAEHLHHRVPGLGWRALTKASLDRDTQSFSAELISPPNDDRWRWSTAVQFQNQRSGTFDVGSQRLRGGASQGGERIDRSYYLQYDRADTAASSGTAIVKAESVSANYAFTLRNFDTMPFPTGGWAWGAEVGGGTTIGNSQVPYSRLVSRWLSYLSLGDRLSTLPSDLRSGRLAFRAHGGAVLAQDGVNLPATQLFLAGGDNSVRGYGLHDIGVNLPGAQVSAGRYMAVGSLEWQRPITVKGLLTEWEGTLFVDAGAVADKPADLEAKVGVGTGVRWKTPVGPLQIDLAYGLAVQQWRLHLNIGFVF